MRVKLLPVLLLLAVAPFPGHGEDLMDAYHQAVANDPVLATANAQRLLVAEGVPVARSALLPQLSAGLELDQIHSGGNSQTTDGNGNIVNTGGGGHTRDRSLSGTLSQPIINLSAFANLRAAHAASDAQDQTYRAALQNLYVRVASAYFNVLVAQDSVDINSAYENAYKQEYDQTSTRFKNGLAMAADVAQSKAYYLYIKSQRISAQDQLKDARRALEQITGQPVGTLKKLRDDLPMQPPKPDDAKAWVDAALKTNPVILAGRYTVNADEHKVSAARAQHLPTLSASLSRGKDTTWLEHGSAAGITGNGRYGTTVGLTLTVPIFSGGYTQSVVRQSIDQRDSAQDSLESQRRQVRRATLNYYRSVLAGISQVQSGKAAVESGEKALDATRAGFQVGTQTMTDVLLAINTLTSAESTYSQNRHQFILDKLLLEQAAGTADLKDLEKINALLQ